MNLTKIKEGVAILCLAGFVGGAVISYNDLITLKHDVKSNGREIKIVRTMVTEMAKRPMIMLMPQPKMPKTIMIDPLEFKKLIVQPTLDDMSELWGPQINQEAAVNQIIGTYLKESVINGVTHITQLNDGPAKGVFQIEPDTELSIWDDYLAYRPDKASFVRGLMEQHLVEGHDLVSNLRYQVVMCRLKYWQRSFKWPQDPNDIRALGVIWNKEYNANPDHGTVTEYVERYEAAGDF